ncbi:hypothetical protein [Sphingomonas koreensis]|nr:hypothetical protein [Sphingomonas koreensis]
MDDARALELASYDRSKREWFLAVPVELEQRGHRDIPVIVRRNHRGEPWTYEQLAQLRAMAQAGEAADMIAVRMGRSARAVRSKAREEGIRILSHRERRNYRPAASMVSQPRRPHLRQ